MTFLPPLTAGRRFGILHAARGRGMPRRRSVAARAGADGRNPKGLFNLASKLTRRSIEILVLFQSKNDMKVMMRPTGRIIFSCNLACLYQGYYGVHQKIMRSLFMHEELLSRRNPAARQKEEDARAEHERQRLCQIEMDERRCQA